MPALSALSRRSSPALGAALLPVLLVCAAAAAAPSGAHPVERLRSSWLSATTALAHAEILAGRLDAAERLTAAARSALEGSQIAPLDAARLTLAAAEIGFYRVFLVGPPYDESIQALRGALRAAEAADDPALVADARDLLALALFSRDFRASDHPEARGLLDAALATRRELADHRGVAESLFHLGLTHEHGKDPGPADAENARRLYRDSLAEATAHGFAYEASYPERHLAGIADDRGELAAARAGFERSLALRREAGATLVVAPALTALADVLAKQGETARARGLYEEAIEIAKRIGSPSFESAAREGLQAIATR